MKIKSVVVILCLYAIASLSLILVFSFSSRLRFTYFEILTQAVSQVKSLEYVFIGDSITKGGDNWGWQLEKKLVISKNLAVNNYTTRQVATQVEEALGYNPRYVFILAGTNDAIASIITVEQTIEDYEQLLDRFIRHNSLPVITLIPFQDKQFFVANSKIEKINRELIAIANRRGISVIDLNPIIAPSGYLLPQYTSDGVHFTKAAYEVWRNKINNFLTQTESS